MSATAATSELRERLVHQGKEVAEVVNDVVRETREKGKAWWERGRLRLFKFEVSVAAAEHKAKILRHLTALHMTGRATLFTGQ